MNQVMETIVSEFHKELIGSGHYEIGKVFKRNGKLIYIIGGCYLDSIYGRLSNFWDWRYVHKDGTLGKHGCGYGECNIKPMKCIIKTTIKVLFK